MANTTNSAVASTDVYKPTPTLMYPHLNKRLLAKYRVPNVFEIAAQNRTAEDAGTTDTIDFKKFGALIRGGKLLETDRVPLQNIDASGVQMKIYEWGNGASITEKARKHNSIDPFFQLVDELAFDARKVHDLKIRDSFYSTSNIKNPNNHAVSELTSDDKFSFELMEDLTTTVELQEMFTFRDPAIGEYVFCFIHPVQHKQIRAEMQAGDSDAVKRDMWTFLKDYGSMGITPFQNEVGMYHNIRFISTPEVKQGINSAKSDSYDADLTTGGGAGVNAVSALLVGREGAAYYDQMLPQLRMDSEDFDRLEKMAWIAYWGNAMLQEQSLTRIYTAGA